MDQRKAELFITLRKLDYTAGDLTTIPDVDSHTIKVKVEKGSEDDAYFIAKEYSLATKDDSVYHLPFILNADGSPWHEANLFFYRQSVDEKTGYKPTDDLRRKASLLFDYKLFCEDEGLDYLDFSAARPPGRPSYRYFNHLKDVEGISGKGLNTRTQVVYEFYQFLSSLPGFSVDIERVEKTKEAFIKFSNGHAKTVTLRSQTVRASSLPTEVPIGYVRDDGDDLRPLTNEQRDHTVDVLGKEFSVDERLVHLIALNTGARKQTIYTLRMKHVSMFSDENRAPDGAYMLRAGPGTGIDTKNKKAQTLYFPEKLVAQLRIYADSKLARERRELFCKEHGDILSDGDMYLFLSKFGNCFYMARNDPRYRKLKTRPQGEHTHYLKTKLFKHVSPDFPKDFTFHWLRATYAYSYYQYLAPLVAEGKLKPGDEIRRIQLRLHHSDRKITEHYLKLFTGFDEKKIAQENYEDRLFEGVGI